MSESSAAQQQLEQTIRNCTSVLQAGEIELDALLDRADAWRQLGRYAEALSDYADAVREDKEEPAGYAGQAWIWATCPDPEFRDGQRAVKSALKAYRMGDIMALAIDRETGKIDSDSSIFATLAAAYAEVGKFDKARKVIADGLLWAREESAKQQLQSYDELYQKQQPYREPAVPPELATLGKELSEEFAW